MGIYQQIEKIDLSKKQDVFDFLTQLSSEQFKNFFLNIKLLLPLYNQSNEILNVVKTNHNEALNIKNELQNIKNELQKEKREKEKVIKQLRKFMQNQKLKNASKYKEQQDREQKKTKILQRKRLSKRDIITRKEFFEMLAYTSKTNVKASRIRAALILLFYTGLRVSNLLVLTIDDVNQLLTKQTVTLPLIKRGPCDHRLFLSPDFIKTVKDHGQDCFNIIIKNRQQQGASPSDFFFSIAYKKNINGLQPEKQNKPLSRTSFTEEINRVMCNIGKRNDKKFSSHSFRTTLITNLIQNGVASENVRKIVGHQNLDSTAGYDRSTFSGKDIQKVYKALDIYND